MPVDYERPNGSGARHPSELDPEEASRRRFRRRWVVVSAVTAGVLLITSLLTVGLGRDPAQLATPLVGRHAPGFALRTLDGSSTVRLSDLRGQVVIVNFWASWCDPCREEHPALRAAWDRYRDRGVVIVGIVYDDSADNAEDFIRELGGDWPALDDPNSAAALAYGVYGIPETFFIGPDGRVAYRRVGPVSYALLSQQITRLLGERSV
ncbi:TlpA disulfide reductase family protein [soil metagenome]|nr:TlpA family protein disulfide reductase [Actinomycetota bacterium]